MSLTCISDQLKLGSVLIHTGNTPLESLHLGPNIKTIKWAPQNDVLGHPAVGVFLTQGGINSLYEAAYHAKPVVTIPLIADQEGNAVKVCCWSGHLQSCILSGTCCMLRMCVVLQAHANLTTVVHELCARCCMSPCMRSVHSAQLQCLSQLY